MSAHQVIMTGLFVALGLVLGMRMGYEIGWWRCYDAFKRHGSSNCASERGAR